MDKNKLVLVQVQVNGKNGTFTRGQWKRMEDLTPEEKKKYAGKDE